MANTVQASPQSGYGAQDVPARRLFILSCVALTVTAMTFAIRAGMMTTLQGEFALTGQQIGIAAAMFGFGFPIATVFGGLIYNRVGPKTLMIIAFLGHLLGLALWMLSGDFTLFAISTFLIGFANGSVEAACNPMIAELYPENKTTILNRFHVWFPGGLAIGALVAFGIQQVFGEAGPTWQVEVAVMLLPTIIYGFMIFTTRFPDVKADTTTKTDTATNIKAMLTPLFVVMCLIMTVTAATELSTNGWVGGLLEASGAAPLVVLALVSVIMALGRFFAGPLVHAFNTTGVLLFSAIVTTLGIFLLSTMTGGMTYVAAIVFAIGITYFWPTMIGFIAEYLPDTGALGMSVVGGMGMVGFSIWTAIIGGWIDSGAEAAAAAGLTGDAATLAAGQGALGKILYLPLALIVAFGILFLIRKRFVSETTHD
jgi:MFS family permease